MNYQEQFERQILELKITNQPIILFGCGLIGKIGMKAVTYFNKKVVCFCDNDERKHGTEFAGVKVVSPKEACENYPDAKVYLCLLRTEIKQALKKQLQEIGFSNIIDGNVLIGAYNIYILERNFDAEQYLDALENLDKKESYVHDLNLIITEKCTLRCKECGVFIPYYKHPVHHDAHKAIKAIQNFGKTVKTIKAAAVIGGEPLLHPDLAEVCRGVAQISTVINVSITTNATIVPSKSTLEELKKVLSYVVISDYGTLSTKKTQLMNMLDEVGIPYLMSGDDVEWVKQNMPVLHHRGKENDEIFRNCYWLKAPKIINGQYHLCDYSAGLTPFGMIPDNKGDYVDLLQEDQEKIQEEITALMTRKHCLKACDFCELYALPPTVRAEQAKGCLEFERK